MAATAASRRPARLPWPGVGWLLAAAVAGAAIAAVAGGLLRAGVPLSSAGPAAWWSSAVLDHAALMVGCFMGTVIAVERAVALRRRFAWAVPVLSGAAGVALLAGARELGATLLVGAGALFIVVNAVLLRRQREDHTLLLLASAVAWFAGHALFAAGAAPAAVVPWWFTFLIVTIAAERLEMTRHLRRRPGASGALHALLALQFGAATFAGLLPEPAGVLYGVALVLLAAWLFAFDIARRTVRAAGLPRYMAVCLLGGYGWLAIGGAAWAAMALGSPTRDAALHAVGVGFVLSMMFGHAPVILPAVTRIKVQFHRAFYLPLAVLHASLFLRLAAGATDAHWRAWGAAGNALAIGLFALTLLAAAWWWRQARRARSRSSTSSPDSLHGLLDHA